MIEINDNLYPISNIKNIKIDKEDLTLTFYFNPGTNLYPVVEHYENFKELRKRVDDLSGVKKSNRLLG